MNLSLNETQSLVIKAAKGAGMSWGMAQEAGAAVRFLSSYGLPGAEALLNVLERYDRDGGISTSPDCATGDWHGDGGALCPCAVGAVLCDQCHSFDGAPVIGLQNVAQPLLLIPFVAKVAKAKGVVVGLYWADVNCCVSAEKITISGEASKLLCENAESVSCFAGEISGTGFSAVTRADLSDAVYNGLSQFAHRTYAPATEESRQKGAGAGITDND